MRPANSPFGSRVHLSRSSGQPSGPVVGTNTVTAADLVAKRSPTSHLGQLLTVFRHCINRRIFVSVSAFLSRGTANRHGQTVTRLVLGFNVISPPVSRTLSLCFRRYSILIGARSLTIVTTALTGQKQGPIANIRTINNSRIHSVLDIVCAYKVCGFTKR